MAAAEREDVLVREHAALGRAGGAAGVEEDEQVLRLRLALGGAGVQLADIGGLEHRALEVLQDGQELLIGDQELRIRILHHELQALVRVRGVQGQVGAAGLERAQRGNHHVFVAPQHDAHHALGGHLGFDIGGQVVGQFVGLPVGQADVFIHQGDVVRTGFRLFAESFQNGVAGMLWHGFSVFVFQI